MPRPQRALSRLCSDQRMLTFPVKLQKNNNYFSKATKCSESPQHVEQTAQWQTAKRVCYPCAVTLSSNHHWCWDGLKHFLKVFWNLLRYQFNVDMKSSSSEKKSDDHRTRGLTYVRHLRGSVSEAATHVWWVRVTFLTMKNEKQDRVYNEYHVLFFRMLTGPVFHSKCR